MSQPPAWTPPRPHIACGCGALLEGRRWDTLPQEAKQAGWRHEFPARCPACLAERGKIIGPIICPSTGEACVDSAERGPCDRRFCRLEFQESYRPKRAEHRKPPMPPGFGAKNEPGWCRWCGREIWKNYATRKLSRRRWHPACLDQFFILTRPEATRRAVWDRDEGRCYICGKQHQATPRLIWTDEYGDIGKGTLPQSHIGWTLPSGWQAEHKVPLWKVAHLPDAERLKYFLLDNIGIACDRPCHENKTRAEATERAKLERIGEREGMRQRRLNKAERRAKARKQWEEMP